MRERFNTVAVAIPAQQFHVRCHVSIERQVPVMTDFAVRLLHLTGPLEIGAMQEYFGLSGNELVDLLGLLRSEGLVEESGGRFSLTSYAEGRFVGSSDGLPRFTRIVERQSRPVFELLSYAPIPKALSGTYWDNALELDWASDDEAHGQTIERAEAAFHQHFLDIERFQQDEEWRRAYSCYKVDSITSGRPFNVPLPVHFDVDLTGTSSSTSTFSLTYFQTNYVRGSGNSPPTGSGASRRTATTSRASWSSSMTRFCRGTC